MHVNKKIIYVSHDAHFHGAQLLSLHTIKALKENFDYSVAIISIGSGILIQIFKSTVLFIVSSKVIKQKKRSNY